MLKENSLLMQLALRLGLESVAWPLRRLHCPVDSEALVLEVGSGGSPYPRANVLLDAYEETRHRHWAPLVADRPTVLGFAENLPFRDRSFDLVIASHVLEHSPDPEAFLRELQRVAKAGYIEVPDAFLERINPYRDHRLEITVRNNRLLIRKKAARIQDPELVELYEHRVKPLLTRELIPKHPFSFHVRYYWRDRIDYVILNPEQCADWEDGTDGQESHTEPPSFAARMKGAVLRGARSVLSQRARNGRIDLTTLLRCPHCSCDQLSVEGTVLVCTDCSRQYSSRGGVVRMNEEVSSDGSVADGSRQRHAVDR